MVSNKRYVVGIILFSWRYEKQKSTFCYLPFYLNAILRLSIFTQSLLVAMCDWENQQWQFNGLLLMFSKTNNKKMIKDGWQLQSELYETLILIKEGKQSYWFRGEHFYFRARKTTNTNIIEDITLCNSFLDLYKVQLILWWSVDAKPPQF